MCYLKSAKLPDGIASNISKCVNASEKKISGYKSHDAHFMLHYLLQVPIRCTMLDVVAGPLIRLAGPKSDPSVGFGLLRSQYCRNTFSNGDDISS